MRRDYGRSLHIHTRLGEKGKGFEVALISCIIIRVPTPIRVVRDVFII